MDVSFFIPASFVHLRNYAVDLNNCKIYSSLQSSCLNIVMWLTV